MSRRTLCRLCVTGHEEYKCLFDDYGQENSFYEITLKYFDPILLTPDETWNSTVICLKCWHHIDDFHNFQQTILSIQSNLHSLLDADIKDNVAEVKTEDSLPNEMTLDIKAEEEVTKVEELCIDNDHHNEEIDDNRFDSTDSLDIKVEDTEIKVEELCVDNDHHNEEFDDNRFDSTDSLDIKVEDTEIKVEELCIDNDHHNEEFDDNRFDSTDSLDIKVEDTEIKVEELCIDNDHHNEEFDDNRFDSTDSDDDDDLKPLIYHVLKSKERKNQSTEAEENREDNMKDCNGKDDMKIKKLKKVKPVFRISRKRKNATNCSADEMETSNEAKTNKDQKPFNAKSLEWDNFIAKWKSELECLHCTTTVANFSLLRKHYHNHHPKEKLYTKCCDRRFAKRFTLFEHIQLHLNPKVFECDICGLCGTSSSNLAKHKQDLHTEEGKLRPFECDICKKNYTSKHGLRLHKEGHESSRDHICNECGKGYQSESHLKIHERRVHNVDRICDQCGKSVHGIYAFRKHLMEHKGGAKTKWPCDICGAELHSHSNRKRHKEMKHNDGTTAYICSECGKGYTSQPALMGHKRVAHAKEFNFKCNYCEKSFKTPKNLREHTARHTGIDIYQCPHCPRTFKMSSNMHHHRKKLHPKEWAEGRVNKCTNKLNLSLIANEVVI